MSTRTTRAAGPLPVQGADRRLRRAVAVAAVATVAVVAAGAAAGAALLGDDEPARRSATAAGPSVVPSAAATDAAGPAGPSAGPSAAASSAATAAATPVEAWREAVLKEYSPLAQSSFSAVRTVTEWNNGRATAQDVRSRVEVALTTSQETVQALAARTPLPGTEASLAQYRAGADLYVQSLRVVLAATALPEGPLQTQLRRAAARQRDLGDRLFDLAGTSLVPLLPEERRFDDVRLVKPPEVPDYDAIDLGVGPPLEPREPAGAPVRTYQETRPEQSAAAWSALLDEQDLPDAGRLGVLVREGAAGQLAASARAFVQASDRLHRAADPRGERVLSTQVQLGLLVTADGLRTAQAAALAPAAQQAALRESAGAVTRLGAALAAARPGATDR